MRSFKGETRSAAWVDRSRKKKKRCPGIEGITLQSESYKKENKQYQGRSKRSRDARPWKKGVGLAEAKN